MSRSPCIAAGRTIALAKLTLALSLAGALGCGEDFDPASQVDSLRVLGVRKSAPYARPGQSVDLELLWHDAIPDRPRPQIAWLALCENPDGDLFTGCLSSRPSLDPSRISLPDPVAERANDHFSFATSANIISSRPPPKDPGLVPYGLDYVFFAVCAGSLALQPEAQQSPLVCYQELDDEPGFSAGDQQLDSRDFVFGYTEIFSYDELDNANPLVDGVEFDGRLLYPGQPPLDSNGEALDAPALTPEDFCIGSGCSPAPAFEDPSVCPEALSYPPCAGDCPSLRISPLVDPASAELDVVSSGQSDVLLEQMWVNYYATAGEVGDEVTLLNDAIEGWQADYGTDYAPSEEAAVSYLWSVAHDNRGGSQWARLRVCTR